MNQLVTIYWYIISLPVLLCRDYVTAVGPKALTLINLWVGSICSVVLHNK